MKLKRTVAVIFIIFISSSLFAALSKLEEAILSNNDDKKIITLIFDGANVNKIGLWGLTPLMLAASQGRFLIIKRLIAAGANVNVKGPSRRTALFYARKKGKLVIVRYLEKAMKQNKSKYRLSGRTVTEMKELKKLMKSAKVLNVLVKIAPFVLLLGSNPVDATFSIASTDWSSWISSVKGLNVWQKKRLANFCKFEALKQRKSKDDFRFWLKMANSFR